MNEHEKVLKLLGMGERLVELRSKELELRAQLAGRGRTLAHLAAGGHGGRVGDLARVIEREGSELQRISEEIDDLKHTLKIVRDLEA